MIQAIGFRSTIWIFFEKDDLFRVGYLLDMSEDGSKYYGHELEGIE